MNNQLGFLPPNNNFDDIHILKALNLASRALAELKGETKAIPNSDILINTLVELELLAVQKIGKTNYYVNTDLFDLLTNANKL